MADKQEQKPIHISTQGKRVISRASVDIDSRQLLTAFGVMVVFICILFLVYRNPAEWLQLLFYNFAQSAVAILPLAVICTLSLLAGTVFYWKHRRSRHELKIIETNETGIKLGRILSSAERKADLVARQKAYLSVDRTYGRIKNQTIDWRMICAVEAIHGSTSFGGENSFLLIETIDSVIYKLRWENAFSWIDDETLVTMLREKAPQATLLFPRLAIKSEVEDSRYTKLWLEYFSTPGARARKGQLEAGTVLNEGQYQIERVIGAGGQGFAYLARQLQTAEGESADCQVVLKEYILPLHRGESLSQERSAQLNHEAELLSKIDHPGIVKMTDCFVEDHRGYLVLEYILGNSLRHIVQTSGPQTEASVVKWSIEICDILQYLHEMLPPIVHRDLTPENLILNTTDSIRLVDFTVAHQLESRRTAVVVGKQSYIPPEQFRGKAMPQSDLYALGCSMYFLLTGADPEPMSESHPRIKSSNVPEALDNIIGRATKLDSLARYPSALHMKADLHALATKRTPS